MKLNDTAAGLVIVLFGLAVALYARTFPPMPGQPVGPSLFPAAAGSILAVLGLALIAAGLRDRSRPAIALDDWVRARRPAFRFLAVIAALAFYAYAVDLLGFFITAFTVLGGLMLVFDVRPRLIVPVAAAVTLAVHFSFYTLLRVPLPWGLLERVAW